MKKLTQIGLIYALLLGCPMLLAQLGCLDNSWHLREKFDHKQYHPVKCNCPCDWHKAQGLYAKNLNKCLECGHRHDPKPIIFMKNILSRTSSIRLPETPKVALKRLVAHWRTQQKTPSEFDK